MSTTLPLPTIPLGEISATEAVLRNISASILFQKLHEHSSAHEDGIRGSVCIRTRYELERGRTLFVQTNLAKEQTIVWTNEDGDRFST